MRPHLGSPWLALVLLLLAFGGISQGHAQESEKLDSKAVVEELSIEGSPEKAAALLLSIRVDVENDNHYWTLLGSASHEDSLVLERQIVSGRIRATENLHRLAHVLVELEKSEPQPQLRARVEAVFDAASPLLRAAVLRIREKIDRLRAQRSTTAPERRPALEDRIARSTRELDAVYSLWAQHIAKVKLLGLDPEPQLVDFKESLLLRADELSGRLDLALSRVDEYSALAKENPSDSNWPSLLSASKKSLDNNSMSLNSTLELMSAQGLATDLYRTQLVSATRDISSGLLDKKVAASLLARWTKELKEWFVASGPKLLVRLLLFLLILFAFRVLARVITKAVERGLSSSKIQVSQLLTRMIINTSGRLVMLIGLMVALSQLGVSLGPMMAGLGVVGFILGFALQDSLSNFAAGMMILFYRPYDVGDLVDISGVFGKVDKMSLVSTTILTLDHQTLVVPNSKIWGDVIKNVTAQKQRRVDMTFGISYKDDIPKAEKIFEGILKDHPKVLEYPEPMVRLHTLGDSSVDFVVRPWVKTDDYWDVYWDVTRSVKMRLDEEGVSIPFPQRDVHIYEEVLAERTGTGSAPVQQAPTHSSSQTSLDSPSDDDSDS